MLSFSGSSKFNDNCLKVTARTVSLLDIPLTATTIKEVIMGHSDYPSLLAISDALSTWRIKNVAVESTIESFKDLQKPFIKTDKHENNINFPRTYF